MMSIKFLKKKDVLSEASGVIIRVVNMKSFMTLLMYRYLNSHMVLLT